MLILIIFHCTVLFTDSTASKVTIADFNSINYPSPLFPHDFRLRRILRCPNFLNFILCFANLCLYCCCLYIFSESTASNVMVTKFNNELLSSMNLLKTSQDAISSKVDGALKRVSHNEEKGIFAT